MKKSRRAVWIVSASVVLVLSLGGCLWGSNPEHVAKLTELESRIEKLAIENADAYKRFQEGTLTSAEFKSLVDANIAEAQSLRDEVKKLQDAGITVQDALAVGAAGGVIGRTLLHGGQVAAGALPPPWGPILSGVLGLLLGGSKSKEPKKDNV